MSRILTALKRMRKDNLIVIRKSRIYDELYLKAYGLRRGATIEVLVNCLVGELITIYMDKEKKAKLTSEIAAHICQKVNEANRK